MPVWVDLITGKGSQVLKKIKHPVGHSGEILIEAVRRLATLWLRMGERGWHHVTVMVDDHAKLDAHDVPRATSLPTYLSCPALSYG